MHRQYQVEILNPMHPLTEKLTIFVKTYLDNCLTKEDLHVLSERFDSVLDLLRQVIESTSGEKLDALLAMWAGILAGKWRLPYSGTLHVLVFVEGQLRNVLQRSRRER